MPPSYPRQLALLTLLSDRPRGLPRTSISRSLPHFYPASDPKSLEASRKKLQRDAEALTALGLPITCTPNADGEESFALSPAAAALPDSFVLSPAETSGLRRLLSDPVLSGQLDEPSRRALANLLAFHAPFDEDAAGEELDHSQDEVRLARLLAMARAETVAQITYPSRTGKLETRCVSPIGGWLYRGKAYVVGVCHRDIFSKTFAVARISRLEAADELYLQAEDGFDLQAYATRSQFRLEQEIGLRRVTLKVSAEEAWRLKESDPEAVVQEYPDGAVKAEFEVTSPRRFYQYVLGFGRYGSIVSPPELKAGFAAFLRGCL